MSIVEHNVVNSHSYNNHFHRNYYKIVYVQGRRKYLFKFPTTWQNDGYHEYYQGF